MEKERLGVNSETFQENQQLIIDTFRKSLRECASALAQKKGINFEDLSTQDQFQRMLHFLQEVYGRMSQERALSFELEARSSASEEKEISSETIELTVCSLDRENTIRLGADRKKMLAYFVQLTEEKVNCGLAPWVTRKELTEYVQPIYSLAQLDAHLFDPLAELGVLEVNYKKGHRLAARPADVWKALQGGEPHYSLKAKGFESWIENTGAALILVEEYQLPLIRAVFRQCLGNLPEKFLEIPALCESANLSKDGVYEGLRRLEELGLIKRATRIGRYRIGDVGVGNVSTLLNAQEEKIVLRIKFKETAPKTAAVRNLQSDIQTVRMKPLDVQGQEEFDFPAVSWQKKEVSVRELDFEDKLILEKIGKVLFAEMQPTVIFARDKRLVYSTNLPGVDDVDQETILGIMEFLGFGPEELERYVSDPTLAAAIRRLETQVGIKEQLFCREVKSRLLSLIFGEVVLPKEGGEYAWADLLSDLERSLEKKAEPLVAKQETRTAEEVVKEVPASFAPNQKLLELMEPIIRREISSALSQPSIQVDRLPPTSVFNYHRALSIKADLIPWNRLLGLGLVGYEEGDYHPRIGPGGALLVSLFLSSGVHNRALAVTRGETRAIQVVAAHLTHFLLHHSREESELSKREEKYLKNCLQDLESARLFCTCRECQLE